MLPLDALIVRALYLPSCRAGAPEGEEGGLGYQRLGSGVMVMGSERGPT